MPYKTVINGGDGVFLRWSFGKLTVILQSLAKKASSLKGAFTVGSTETPIHFLFISYFLEISNHISTFLIKFSV